MNGFIGPFLIGFASCGALVVILAVGVWIGANVANRKKGEPKG